MNETPSSEAGVDPSNTARHLALLWGCVAAFGLFVVVLLKGDAVIWGATDSDDIGPLDGLVGALAVVGGVVFGALPLGLAIAASFPGLRRRGAAVRLSLPAVLYTALCGLVTGAYWVYGAEQTAAERRIEHEALRQGEILMGSPAVIGLIPLCAYLVVRLARSSEQGTGQGRKSR